MARHPLLVFLALAFGWSWSLELAARGLDGGAGEALHVAAKFGPSLAGLCAAFVCGGRVELRALLSQALRWRVGFPWYALAIFGPLVVWMLSCLYIAAVRDFVVFDSAGLALFVPLLAKHFFVGGGLGEELGWRGFLQSTLERRHGFVGASVAVGVVWGLWHAPVFLLPTAGRSGGVAMLGIFTLLCVGYSLIFARVLHGARDSLLIVALLHAATNAAEHAVKNGFPGLRDAAPLPFIYGGFVLALTGVALVLRPRAGRTDAEVRRSWARDRGSP